MAFDGAPQDRSGLIRRCSRARKRNQELRSKQMRFLNRWQVEAEIFYPERANFTTTISEMDEVHEGLYTGTPQMMSRDLANKLGAMMRPRGKKWFNTVIQPKMLMDMDDVRLWCEEATETLRNIIYSSKGNFTSANAECDRDYVTFGNAVLGHTYNRDRTGINFRCVHLKNVCWAVNVGGWVDELHEDFEHLTIEQIKKMFGKENLPKEWQDKCDDPAKSLEKVKITLVVMPRERMDYDKGEHPPASQKYVGVYFVKDKGCEDNEAALGEAFYESFPYTVKRWMTVSGEDYGRSPCTGVALADARTLNQAERSLLIGIERKAEPAYYAAHDSIIGEVNFGAGEVTYVSMEDVNRSGMNKPIDILESGDPRYAMDYVRNKEERMRVMFWESILKLPHDKVMTAFEVSERMEEMITSAAPIFEPMESDNARMMDSIMERAFAQGAFPPIPESATRGKADQEFETPLTEAIRKLEAQQALNITQQIGAGKDVYGPSFGDHVDQDELERDMLKGLGKQKWVKREDDVAKSRQAKAQQQAAAQQQQADLEAGSVLANANPENLNMLKQEMEQ